MLNIRRGMFETNSSSMHSIALDSKELARKYAPDPEQDYRTLKPYLTPESNVTVSDMSNLDFGWGYDVLSDFGSKLVYALSSFVPQTCDPSEEWCTLIVDRANPETEENLRYILRAVNYSFGDSDRRIENIYLPRSDRGKESIPEIDHESAGMLRDYIDARTEETGESKVKLLHDFLYDDNILVLIMNDNSMEYGRKTYDGHEIIWQQQ